MKLDVVAKVLATVILVLVGTGALIANHDCLLLDCGNGSKRCFARAVACNYCNGSGAVEMCAIVQSAFCNPTANVPCGSNMANGRCLFFPGAFRGTCGGGTPDGNPCGVLGC